MGRSVRDPYREDREVEQWKERDPILIHKQRLLEQGVATQEEIDQMENEVKQQIEDAVTFARESPYPDPSDLFEDMFADKIALE